MIPTILRVARKFAPLLPKIPKFPVNRAENTPLVTGFSTIWAPEQAVVVKKKWSHR
jgi:hypothetical protein